VFVLKNNCCFRGLFCVAFRMHGKGLMCFGVLLLSVEKYLEFRYVLCVLSLVVHKYTAAVYNTILHCLFLYHSLTT